jgi:hypothetical protein
MQWLCLLLFGFVLTKMIPSLPQYRQHLDYLARL